MRGPARHVDGGSGFSLLEALIALVIVSVSLGVLFQVVSGSLRLSARAVEAFEVRGEARRLFMEALPEDVQWQDMEWGNSTADGEWTLEVHPVSLRESLEKMGLASGRNLFRFDFNYVDTRSGRRERLSSYRNIPEASLPYLLETAGVPLDWAEHDRFMESLGR